MPSYAYLYLKWVPNDHVIWHFPHKVPPMKALLNSSEETTAVSFRFFPVLREAILLERCGVKPVAQGRRFRHLIATLSTADSPSHWPESCRPASLSSAWPFLSLVLSPGPNSGSMASGQLVDSGGLWVLLHVGHPFVSFPRRCLIVLPSASIYSLLTHLKPAGPFA